MRILLVGNPNVGKSTLFTRLTGIESVISNFPGTTIEVSMGMTFAGGNKAEVVDLPGTYSLDAASQAEEVAVRALREMNAGGVIVCVADSRNIERSLNLVLQVLKMRKPVVLALNFWDDAEHLGIKIDVRRLEDLLGVSCVPVSAIAGMGIATLAGAIGAARVSCLGFRDAERWREVGKLVAAVQVVTRRHHSIRDRLADASVQPFSGVALAAVVMFVSFEAVRLIGGVLAAFVAAPLFERLWRPVVEWLSLALGSGGLFHDLLVGRLVGGKVNFGESLGLLTTGLYVPLGEVLPYVAGFYLVLSLVEDIGYLPRLAVLADNVMHTVGLHGMGIIPMFLGLGCNVTGALASRIMESERERFIAMTLMAVGVPCMAQLSVVAALARGNGMLVFVPVFGTLFAVAVVLGLVMNRFIGGEGPEILLDIPPYQPPRVGLLGRKLWMRLKWFIREGVPWVAAGVVAVNLLQIFGVLAAAGWLLSPVVTGLLGLPAGSVAGLLAGILRKDVAVGMLVPLHMAPRQMAVASVVLTMYFPCAATFAVMARELGPLGMIKSAAIMIVSAFLAGAFLNILLGMVPAYA